MNFNLVEFFPFISILQWLYNSEVLTFQDEWKILQIDWCCHSCSHCSFILESLYVPLSNAFIEHLLWDWNCVVYFMWLSYLMLSTTPRVRYYYYLYFIGKETSLERSNTLLISLTAMTMLYSIKLLSIIYRLLHKNGISRTSFFHFIFISIFISTLNCIIIFYHISQACRNKSTN